LRHALPDSALQTLLSVLNDRGYRFVTPNNATIRHFRHRPENTRASDLRGALGWSLPFARGSLDEEVEALLSAAGLVEDCGDLVRSTVRVSTVHDSLFLHSAYPTNHDDAVFLGPDTYRFAAFLRQELGGDAGAKRILDIGTGAGVGAVVAGRLTGADHICVTDINPLALRLARVNAAHAGLAVTTILGSGLEGVERGLDLVIANPPFIADGGRTYSDGGDLRGLRLSLDWAEAAIPHLRPGGRLLMYTGSPIVAGDDPFEAALEDLARSRGCHLAYRELDPDIFGAQLARPAYADVERIAAVGVAMTRA
jgi:hypothetical protein